MNTSTRHVCTADDPWDPTKSDRAEHPDAVIVGTDDQSMYGSYEEYKCPHCNKRFWVELPD